MRITVFLSSVRVLSKMAPAPNLFPPMEFTPQEQQRLGEFRKACENLELSEDQRKDGQLIRWLRARSLNVNKATKMLETHLKWRKDNEVDGIVTRETVPPAFQSFMRTAYLGVDAQGYPILLTPLGPQDTRGLAEEFGEEMMAKMLIIRMERVEQLLRQVSQEQGREVTQVVQIMDMEGYLVKQNLMHKGSRAFSAKRQEITNEHYPDIIKSYLVLNAPGIMYTATKLFKPFIGTKTMKIMTMYNQNKEEWKKALKEKIPGEMLPKYWGGSREGSDEFCSKDDIWMGGPLPPNFFAGIVLRDDDKLTPVTINARDKQNVIVKVEHPQSTLLWHFRCDDYDIGFQILDPSGKEIVEWKRASLVKENSVVAPEGGDYTLVFDNSYSVTRGKTVRYSCSVVEGNVVELIN